MSTASSHFLGQKRRPGQPLIVLAVLLLGWSGMRFVLWTEPYVMPLTTMEIAGDILAGLLLYEPMLGVWALSV